MSNFLRIRFNVPKITKLGYFLTELFKNIRKVDVFWNTVYKQDHFCKTKTSDPQRETDTKTAPE